jgi:hypothetical protein
MAPEVPAQAAWEPERAPAAEAAPATAAAAAGAKPARGESWRKARPPAPPLPPRPARGPGEGLAAAPRPRARAELSCSPSNQQQAEEEARGEAKALAGAEADAVAPAPPEADAEHACDERAGNPALGATPRALGATPPVPPAHEQPSARALMPDPHGACSPAPAHDGPAPELGDAAATLSAVAPTGAATSAAALSAADLAAIPPAAPALAPTLASGDDALETRSAVRLDASLLRPSVEDAQPTLATEEASGAWTPAAAQVAVLLAARVPSPRAPHEVGTEELSESSRDVQFEACLAAESRQGAEAVAASDELSYVLQEDLALEDAFSSFASDELYERDESPPAETQATAAPVPAPARAYPIEVPLVCSPGRPTTSEAPMQSPRFERRAVSEAPAPVSPTASQSWECRRCTFRNPLSARACEMCAASLLENGIVRGTSRRRHSASGDSLGSGSLGSLGSSDSTGAALGAARAAAARRSSELASLVAPPLLRAPPAAVPTAEPARSGNPSVSAHDLLPVAEPALAGRPEPGGAPRYVGCVLVRWPSKLLWSKWKPVLVSLEGTNLLLHDPIWLVSGASLTARTALRCIQVHAFMNHEVIRKVVDCVSEKRLNPALGTVKRTVSSPVHIFKSRLLENPVPHAVRDRAVLRRAAFTKDLAINVVVELGATTVSALVSLLNHITAVVSARSVEVRADDGAALIASVQAAARAEAQGHSSELPTIAF